MATTASWRDCSLQQNKLLVIKKAWETCLCIKTESEGLSRVTESELALSCYEATPLGPLHLHHVHLSPYMGDFSLCFLLLVEELSALRHPPAQRQALGMTPARASN